MKFLWARLMNTLFGCHYVLIPFAGSQLMRRIRTLNRRGYIKLYDNWYWIDITEEGKTIAKDSEIAGLSKRCTPITYQDGDFT